MTLYAVACLSAVRTVGRLVSDRHWLREGMVSLLLNGQSAWDELRCRLNLGRERVQVFDLLRYCEFDVRRFRSNGGGPVSVPIFEIGARGSSGELDICKDNAREVSWHPVGVPCSVI